MKLKSSKADKADLARKVAHYEAVIAQMQGHTFYCEDDEGVLRRWYPPRVRSDSDLNAADRIKGILKEGQGDED